MAERSVRQAQIRRKERQMQSSQTRPGGRRSLRWVAAAAGALVLTAGVAWNAFGGLPYQLDEEQNVRDAVEVFGDFMAAGELEDASAAEDLVARSSDDADLTGDGISSLFETRPELFDGYAAVSRETFGIGLKTTPLGTRAHVGGEVSYDGRANRPFEAELVKRNNDWRLTEVAFGP